MTNLPHIASRVFHTPLMIDSKKLAAILAVLAPRLGLEPPAVEAALFSEQRSRKPYAVTNGGVAVIEVSGSLVNRASGMDAQSGLTSYEQLGNEILDAATDPQVRGILLRLDSYGGEANGAWDVASLIEEAARMKPVWASVDDWALSAGYFAGLGGGPHLGHPHGRRRLGGHHCDAPRPERLRRGQRPAVHDNLCRRPEERLQSP
jgi:ClpP class serine protease